MGLEEKKGDAVTEKPVKVKIEVPLAIITIDRPPANALSVDTIKALGDTFAELRDDPDVRAIIVTGAGQNVFVAGADITEFQGLAGSDQAVAAIQRGQALFSLIETFPKPVVAAINGACAGGGNELAMSCDFRIAAESARFSQPEIKLGLVPAWGGTFRLQRLIGRGRAMEMLMTGDWINAQQALAWGLVNQVVPDGELLARAKNLARRLALQAPLALAAIKQMVTDAPFGRPEEAYARETSDFLRLAQTEDAREGIKAFFYGGRPQFRGR